MDKPKTLEEANALLLQRRKALGIDETLKPAGSLLKTFDFKPLSPKEAAEAEARRLAWEKEREEARAKEDAEKAVEGFRRRVARAQIPERHAGKELDPHPEQSALLDNLKANLGRGYLVALLGIRGAGKTQVAVEVIRENATMRRESRYVKAMDLIVRFREAFRKDGPSEREVLEEFIRPDLLVIDAMEERGQTDFEDRMISHLIDRRYDGCLDTILISNQTREAFGESIGKSAISRLIETGKVFECNWESFRKRPETPANASLPVGDR
jgi:DNA replication protein DnaC